LRILNIVTYRAFDWFAAEGAIDENDVIYETKPCPEKTPPPPKENAVTYTVFYTI